MIRGASAQDVVALGQLRILQHCAHQHRLDLVVRVLGHDLLKLALPSVQIFTVDRLTLRPDFLLLVELLSLHLVGPVIVERVYLPRPRKIAVLQSKILVGEHPHNILRGIQDSFASLWRSTIVRYHA